MIQLLQPQISFQGISPIEPSRKLKNDEMRFDGVNRFMKFDPSKTAILQFSSRGLSEGIYDYQNNILILKSFVVILIF